MNDYTQFDAFPTSASFSLLFPETPHFLQLLAK